LLEELSLEDNRLTKLENAGSLHPNPNPNPDPSPSPNLNPDH
jgi:hypothetical protein